MAVCGAAAGCGDNQTPPVEPPDVPAAIELPLLVAEDPALAFDASREVTVAAHDGVVVVAAVHEHFADPNSFDDTDFHKRVGVNVSVDGGQTFGAAIDPGHGVETSDPVVRASDAGFFLATMSAFELSAVSRSSDGASWTSLAADLELGDKEWIALDDANEQLYLAARDGLFRIGYDGEVRGTHQPTSDEMFPLFVEGFADAAGGHFAVTDARVFQESVLRWDGTDSAPVLEVPPLELGADATFYTTVTWSYGPLADGTWTVRSIREDGLGAIVLRLDRGGEVTETAVSPVGANAFLPTAVMDERGRLHVAYYDSSGPVGRLVYTHTRSAAPFSDGFVEPITIDPDAVPGGFYPFESTPEGGRRLREYIGIATDGERVHIAWTHSPAPPSRVRVITLVPGD